MTPRATLQVARAACRLGLGIKGTIERRIGGHRLTFADLCLLLEAAGDPGVHLREAARRIGFTRQEIHRSARRLQARGLIAVRQSEPDRRLVRVHPTAAGTTVLAELDDRLEKVEIAIARLLDPFPPDRFLALLHRLTDSPVFALTAEWRWELS